MSVHVNAGIRQGEEGRTVGSMFVPVSESRNVLRSALATTRFGFATDVWGQALEGFSGAARGRQAAVVPSAKLKLLNWGHANTVQETSTESNIFSHRARYSGPPAAAAISKPTSSRTVLQESLSARLVSLSPEKEER